LPLVTHSTNLKFVCKKLNLNSQFDAGISSVPDTMSVLSRLGCQSHLQ